MSDNDTRTSPSATNASYEDDSEDYEDAYDNVEAVDEGDKGEEEKEEKKIRDSLGHTSDSPDFVDEDKLRTWETGEDPMSETDLEQKRLEAAQYKLEGNALYSEGKTLEAVGN